MEIGDRLAETRLVQTERFDQENCKVCRRDLAVCERTNTRILRRELSIGRAVCLNSSKPNFNLPTFLPGS